MNRPPDSRSRPTAVIASSDGVLVYSGRMAEPICARLVTAAMKPIVETASAVYASPAQRYSTPASSSLFRCLPKASGSSRMPTTAPSFIAWPSRPTNLPLSGLHNKGYSLSMSIAVTEDHRALAQTVADFLAKHQARASARGLLESAEEPLPGFWAELAGLGLLGLHRPRGARRLRLHPVRGAGRGRATGPRGGTRPVRPDRDHERGDRRGGAGRPAQAPAAGPGRRQPDRRGGARRRRLLRRRQRVGERRRGDQRRAGRHSARAFRRRRAGHREGARRRHRHGAGQPGSEPQGGEGTA